VRLLIHLMFLSVQTLVHNAAHFTASHEHSRAKS
jgi:hypothetical protein